jgi:UMP-CMP kinase
LIAARHKTSISRSLASQTHNRKPNLSPNLTTQTMSPEASTQTSESPPSKRAPKPTLIYVIGAPGAGKGTLCALLAKNFTNIHHLSVGDHLRRLLELNAEQTFGGLPAEQISRLLQLRSLLPPGTIISIIDDAVKAIGKAAEGNSETQIVLVDGFPRTPGSAPLAQLEWGDPKMVLFFDCPRALAEARFIEHRRAEDDSVEVFRGRYDEFERLNKPILEFYGDKVVRIGTETDTEVTWETLKGRVRGLLSELGASERKE